MYIFLKKIRLWDEFVVKDVNGEEKYWFDDMNFLIK